MFIAVEFVAIRPFHSGEAVADIFLPVVVPFFDDVVDVVLELWACFIVGFHFGKLRI